MSGNIIQRAEPVPDLEDLGIVAFTTTRDIGTFGVNGEESVREVMGRWASLRRELHMLGPMLATAGQVHGTNILIHDREWRGWLRGDDADGHYAPIPGTAVAVTVADCVPVFVVHPSGAVMMLHSGWRGTAAGILERGLDTLKRAGIGAVDLRIHLGPAICGKCYEVSPDVFLQLTGRATERPTPVDLRALLADRARAAGVRRVTVSRWCTRCNNDRFFSHRAGDLGRQIAVVMSTGSS